jgi:hypothetical protein
MDNRAAGNKKMREYDVRSAMMDEMMRGEKSPGMEERLDKVGRESDAEFIRETRGKGKKKMAKGGSVKSSASKRADGCAVKGKTKGKMV